MVTLNVGSGRDYWGDIRLDFARSQTGVANRPNLIASALAIPIRNSAVVEIRCWHVVEHVKDWTRLLAEFGRVSEDIAQLEIRFPIDDGFKRDFLLSWSRVDISGMRHAYLTRKRRAHCWVINPRIVSAQLSGYGFIIQAKRNKRVLFFPFWLLLPRWRQFLPKKMLDMLGRHVGWVHGHFPRLDYEWILAAKRRPGLLNSGSR